MPIIESGRNFELIENLFAVGHLRDRLWGNKTHRIYVFETGSDQRLKILHF